MNDIIAVIDTETTWNDDVMSIGVALADKNTFSLIDKKYYVFEPEISVGGMYSNALFIVEEKDTMICSRREAMINLKEYLKENRINEIFAYNAIFDYSHLKELQGFDWYDIMRLAAYKQYNDAIPEWADTFKTGRLKRGYGVESIIRMLTQEFYSETHNAMFDAIDELSIMRLLGQKIDNYTIAKIKRGYNENCR